MFMGPTLQAWRATLEGRGQLAGGTWPQPAGQITVAAEDDRTCYDSRAWHFLCTAPPMHALRALGCPKDHADRWLGLVAEQPPSYWRDFLAGPGSWLLSRLARLGTVVAWAEHGLFWDTLDDPTHHGWGMVVPQGAAVFFAGSDAEIG